MKRTCAILGLTLFGVLLLDVAVAVGLGWAERANRLGALVRYFEYGRSVPGKLETWIAHPDIPGNLFEVAWRSQGVTRSTEKFAEEPPDSGPVIRSYGMSFVNNILAEAVAQRPALIWDVHAGPGAPPNYTYALFEDDHMNRRPGDIVVLGLLASSIPAMAALSNRTWVFEQPAPFTYPIYYPEAETGLRRMDPHINSAAAERALSEDPEARRAWKAQLAATDEFHSVQTFGLKALDASPFARLVRRSMAKSHVTKVTAAILRDERYPHAEVLERMVTGFAQQTRQARQIPVLLLIQTQDPSDYDLLDALAPLLDRNTISYLATARIQNPRDPAGYLPDGHFTPKIDARLGEAFLELLDTLPAGNDE